jgi:hypothetical protein
MPSTRHRHRVTGLIRKKPAASVTLRNSDELSATVRGDVVAVAVFVTLASCVGQSFSLGPDHRKSCLRAQQFVFLRGDLSATPASALSRASLRCEYSRG